MSNKVETRFGSIWDELPNPRERKERNVPRTQAEATKFFQAAEASITDSTMKVWDSHNDMMAKSAKLRRVSERKKIIERQLQKHRDENRELMEKVAEEKIENANFLKAKALKASKES